MTNFESIIASMKPSDLAVLINQDVQSNPCCKCVGCAACNYDCTTGIEMWLKSESVSCYTDTTKGT